MLPNTTADEEEASAVLILQILSLIPSPHLLLAGELPGLQI